MIARIACWLFGHRPPGDWEGVGVTSALQEVRRCPRCGEVLDYRRLV